MDKTITEIVLESGGPGSFDRNGSDFDLLLNAVVAAGLADTLNDMDADFTVLAPNDDAFTGLSAALGGPTSELGAFRTVVDALTLLGGGDPIPLLTEVLTYHVAAGSAFEADVVAAGEVTTLQGGVLELNTSTMPPSFIDADPGIPDPGLVATDIEASNGVIHVIDGVLLPVSVTGILSTPDTDFIISGGDDDVIRGLAGNDFIDGNGGADILYGGRGSDVMAGGTQGDQLWGRQGADTLLGQNGADIIKGGNGRDTIDGGRGRDMLEGGNGRDVFIYSEGYGRDRIMDFEIGTDQIDLSGLGVDGFDALRINDVNAGARINLGEHTRLTIEGVDAEDLSASDFIF